MDVHCLNCGEPWDTHTLREDLQYELDDDLIDSWQMGKLAGIPNEQSIRDDLKNKEGWQFGHSTLVVQKCPACKNEPIKRPHLGELESAIAEIYGDDLDGYQADMEDFGLN